MCMHFRIPEQISCRGPGTEDSTLLILQKCLDDTGLEKEEDWNNPLIRVSLEREKVELPLKRGREDGLASKMSHTGHNVNPDSKSKNPIQQERPASPVPDCVSMKSNRSMDPPISFGEEAVSPEQSSSSDIPQKSMNQMECPDTEKSQLTVICQEMKSNLMKKELYLFEEQEMDAFDMKKYSKTEEGLLEMLPVIKTCRVILLSECRIPEEFFGPLVSALKSNPSHLEELDLRNNQAVDSGGDLLASLVQDPQCRLATLRLSTFQVTDKGCAPLISALKSNPSHMKELDLCGYVLKGSDVKIISAVLEDPKCRMETLRLSDCQITHDGCGSLASALKSNPSHLKNLDLSGNDLGNVGVQMLVPGLVDPNCKLETLRLSFCGVTEESCGFLAAALNSSHLKNLDLTQSQLAHMFTSLTPVYYLPNENLLHTDVRLSSH
ncbi:hypothetical protein DPEC_G00309720 [Dallia pectoralis]|uniref:Uncharacterized protein n=1 Tax=Dallia pectoralis TaxID=75939 RepID=A0ACC2FF64_DALPE|nr:hypothetical protein DPEC_G00309720 [Dallia pectoralis]